MNSPTPLQTRARGTKVLLLLGLPMTLFLVIPLAALVLRAWSPAVFTQLTAPPVVAAILLSLATTAATTLLAIVLGTPLALLIGRYRFTGWKTLDTLVDLPIVLPPSVAGIALLMAFGRRGFFGELFGSGIAFTTGAVVLAQLFVAAPFYIRAAAAGFAGVDRELESAAAIDGASRWRIFRTVTIPLSMTSLAGGALMTWARALGEFGATIIFAGNFPGRTQTMPLAIYMGFEIDFSSALALSLLLLLVSFTVLFIVKRILHGRSTAL